jgi:hypothetical protein
MSRNGKFALLTIASLAVALHLSAGGFWLQLGSPEANHDAAAKGAIVIVRATGCHDPALAHVAGEVIFPGGRAALKLTPMTEPGTYAVMKQWTGEGPVVLAFSGESSGAHTGLVVRAEGNRVEKAKAKFFMREPNAEDVKAALD